MKSDSNIFANATDVFVFKSLHSKETDDFKNQCMFIGVGTRNNFFHQGS